MAVLVVAVLIIGACLLAIGTAHSKLAWLAGGFLVGRRSKR